MQSRVPTLVILCKRPTLTEGKQRLAKSLGSTRTKRVAEALLDCALEDARAWPGAKVLAPARHDDCGWAREQLPSATVLPQPPGNLGDRINVLDQQLRAQGHHQLLFIGTDCPALRQEHYHQAGQALANAAVVLAPAEDGGVVMMGNAQAWPDLSELPWSTPRLGEALARCCQQAGLAPGWIAGAYDIDEAHDLIKLHQDLESDLRPARQRLRRVLDEVALEHRRRA